jgi:hypothetical protein
MDSAGKKWELLSLLNLALGVKVKCGGKIGLITPL